VKTYVDLKFADGEYRCALPILQIEEVQTACGGSGIGEIYARVLQGRMASDTTVAHPGFAAYRLSDLVETIRHGLIGGNLCIVAGVEKPVGPLRANQLVDRYIGEPGKPLLLPLKDLWDMAAAILFATIEGYAPDGDVVDEEADDDKKKAPDGGGSTTQEPLPTAP